MNLDYQLPWGLLNKVVTRRRSATMTTTQGNVIAGASSLQSIQARVTERQPKDGRKAEEDSGEGLVTRRSFTFSMNYFTDETCKTKTDIQPGDRLTIPDALTHLDCRITDLHDAAGEDHHIYGTAIWDSPTGT